jgi:hypothetical protein
VAAAALAVWAATASGAERSAPPCPSYPSQAGAQERFLAEGGSPAHDAGRLDDDGDGVACEGLPGPYAGYATIGYNRERKFLYGRATMPTAEAGDEFACLAGNRHFPDGPRLLKVYRELPGPDKAVSRDVGAEARPASGNLLWKLDRDELVSGRYYVAFEEGVRPSPYKPTDCSEFRSDAVLLPRPQGATGPPRSGPPRRHRLRARGPR